MVKMLPAIAAVVVAGCVATPRQVEMMSMQELQGEIVETRHAGDDDLLSAGLGLDALRLLPPPASAQPDASELRRRSIWNAWRGIADLRPQTMPQALPSVPGREFSAYLRLPGDRSDHRVVMQVPDDFDHERPCLLVAPSSGSRGVYGAIAVAAPIGLARGCAVVYTDKGGGSDFRLLEEDRVYVPHAHSGDNPESRWGEHTLLAARFGLHVLNRLPLRPTAFTSQNTHVVAVGISNGGGAVLRAAELDDTGLLDAVIAGAPNIQPDWTQARTLYDYATEAGLYQPCLLAHSDFAEAPFVSAELRDLGQRRCRLLKQAGLLSSNTASGLPREAHDRLRSAGWEEGTLHLAGQNVVFDLWRAVAVTYASAYGRFPADQHPCGYFFASLDAQGRPRSPGLLEQTLWRSEGSGIPPTAGVAIVDPGAGGEDPALPSLMCLRRLWHDHQGEDARRVHAGVAAVRASARPKVADLTIVHGREDALIPPAFSSRPYVDAVRAHGLPVDYREIENSQHFDAFLALPAMSGYVPLLPEVWRALDASLDQRSP